MLVARRDPPFEAGAHERSSAHTAPRSSRILHGLQLIGSFVAIPVGLASAYSIYHANFTTEARCETLRSNIVSMLDKNADPAALRLLVRRDVVTFESGCSSVDPDAVAAFRKLLAEGGATAARAKPDAQPLPEPARQQVATQPLPQKKPATVPAQPESLKSTRREPDAKPVRQEIEAKPVTGETARKQGSDSAWLEAVRGALVHAPAEPAAGKEIAPLQPASRAATPAKPLGELRAPASVGATPATVEAPALAPATSIADTPAPASQSDHPVPPASIPEREAEMTASVPAAKPERSRLKALIADIPLLGRVVDR